MFDRIIAVDWSASSRPTTGKDSIWIGDLRNEHDPVTANPSTRGRAHEQLRDSLIDAVDHGERVLIGFDFPYAYPQGFAAALGLKGPPWSATWHYLLGQVRDSLETNRNNRFEVASAINARLADHAFWGRPAAPELGSLSIRRDQVRYRIAAAATGLSEWREVELVLRARGRQPQSTWKLSGAGSVGSQTLTGIPVVARLRHDTRLEAVSRVWPFEIKVPDLPEGRGAVIHAEIWPSLETVRYEAGVIRDQAQVVTVVRALHSRDKSGALATLFAAPPPQATEEGWILGVE